MGLFWKRDPSSSGYTGRWPSPPSGQIPVEECHNLSPGASHIRAESSGAGALGDALFHSPSHRLGVFGIVIHILKSRRCDCGRATRQPPQIQHCLAAGAGCFAQEYIGARRADEQPFFFGPASRLGIVSVLGYIQEGVRFRRLRRTHGAPQKCQDLPPGASRSR